MSDNSTKWLCIGGVLSGEWREHQMEPFDVDPYDLNTDGYNPMRLLNPITKMEEYFFVCSKLNETAYERAIIKALKVQ